MGDRARERMRANAREDGGGGEREQRTSPLRPAVLEDIRRFVDKEGGSCRLSKVIAHYKVAKNQIEKHFAIRDEGGRNGSVVYSRRSRDGSGQQQAHTTNGPRSGTNPAPRRTSGTGGHSQSRSRRGRTNAAVGGGRSRSRSRRNR